MTAQKAEIVVEVHPRDDPEREGMGYLAEQGEGHEDDGSSVPQEQREDQVADHREREQRRRNRAAVAPVSPEEDGADEEDVGRRPEQ